MAGRELRITAGRLMGERTRILDNYRLQIVWLVLGGSVLAAAVAFILVRRGMRPLAALAAHAAGIGIDNLGTRLDAARAPRELAPLVASFNAMLERLAAGFARLSQVTEDMAHDLRTPIGTLLGQTEVAQDAATDAAKPAAAVAAVPAAAAKAADGAGTDLAAWQIGRAHV